MFAKIKTFVLEEFSTAWNARNSDSGILLWHGETAINLFRWPKSKEFTILEDFVLKVIERNLGNSDEEIAYILCLEPQDIQSIISDVGLKGEIQGDSSRRTLPDDFTRKTLDGIAFAKEKKIPPPEITGEEQLRAEALELISTFGRNVGRKGVSKARKDWMQKNSVCSFSLPLLAFCYSEQWIFLCGGQPIPQILSIPLSESEKFREIRERRIAPHNAVCHRDEFWLWLQYHLGKSPPERIVFKSVRNDKEVNKWLREQLKIDAEIQGVQKNQRESVCLDDECFELHGDFVCRVD